MLMLMLLLLWLLLLSLKHMYRLTPVSDYVVQCWWISHISVVDGTMHIAIVVTVDAVVALGATMICPNMVAQINCIHNVSQRHLGIRINLNVHASNLIAIGSCHCVV